MHSAQYNAKLPGMFNVIVHSEHKGFLINWFHTIRYSEFIKHNKGLNWQVI